MIDPKIARKQAGSARILRECDATAQSHGSPRTLAENTFLHRIQ